jgi:hypothetical protein
VLSWLSSRFFICDFDLTFFQITVKYHSLHIISEDSFIMAIEEHLAAAPQEKFMTFEVFCKKLDEIKDSGGVSNNHKLKLTKLSEERTKRVK